MGWQVTQLNKVPKLCNSVLVEGLPGIGNVGKIALDFIIEQIKPVEIYDFYSHSMPHSVFVNQDNLVELPKLRLLALRRARKPSLVFLAGDIQPVDEVSSHEFVETLLDMADSLDIKRIVTLGGIGMSRLPREPKVYVTGNSKDAVKEFSDNTTKRNLVGVVGPIVGVTGLLPGLAAKRNIPAVAYLVESFAHPLHVGIKEARVLLKLLNKKLNLGIKLESFDKGIRDLEKTLRLKTREIKAAPKPISSVKETSYIG
ncbi:hypothetical protein DRJ48_00105 [Candidatus Woesearchaeota archaeon]|nr:PAC2 family protein [Candidatus Woesearchaeota archaeon]RLE43732.1 MAG: hypothetical protein DRJ48_00105 [Candidatus Woesearchaeota archaeon]